MHVLPSEIRLESSHVPFQYNDDDWRQFPDDNALNGVALGLAARAVPATVARHPLFLAEVQQTALTNKQHTGVKVINFLNSICKEAAWLETT